MEAKLAVTLLLPFIATTVGLVEPLASPLQLLNVYPLFAVAVRVTLVPEEYCVPLLQFGNGIAATVPVPLGFTLFVSV